VSFRGGRLEPYVNACGLVVRVGDFVLVEAERGKDLGWVVACDAPQIKPRKNQQLRELMRQATDEEVARLEVLAKEDRGALEICRGRAEHFGLEMKIIDAETQFDGNRVTFYFTAERRVDFRELVRDLASIFRTRIELRQVGARDAARRCDGVGPCGRHLCCTTFLREFEPVTLKMAKEQNLSLNPAKISGACGRLMCCLTYECKAYRQAVAAAPRLGSRWRYEDLTWVVSAHDVGNHRILLEDAEGETLTVDLDRFSQGAHLLDSEAEGETGGSSPEAGDHG
jgi:cell fate regulator YaaT (PSP1 superfamily)